MKKILLILSSLIILSACNILNNDSTQNVILSFEECVAAGHPVTDGEPKSCLYGQMVFWENDGVVDSFEDCVAAGNPVMESYPRQCNHGDRHFVEDVTLPTPADECSRDFQPVCGEMEVQCSTTPCNPVKVTFENRCLAENEGAQNIKKGACSDEAPNPEGACLSFDGVWLPEFQECEGMAPQQCSTLGGTPNECASACRNDADAEVCTLQCVLVCQF